MCHRMCGGRGQRVGVGSLLLPCWELNSSFMARAFTQEAISLVQVRFILREQCDGAMSLDKAD